MIQDKPLIQMTASEFLDLMREAAKENHEETKPPEYVKGIANLAARLHVSTPTVQKWKNEGKIPYIQQGRFVYFDFDRVLEALNNR
jgi:excisionase family DNA binding protein